MSIDETNAENWREKITKIPGFVNFVKTKTTIGATFNYACDDIDGAIMAFWFAIPSDFREKHCENTHEKFFELYHTSGRFWFDFYHNVSIMLEPAVRMYKDS